ncbi:MAG TPA: M48 family metallopeptidase [Acidobacteriota bacterium]|nr:M48 family metallopeptidase [Acidobacteriota bacterium]
MPRKTTKKTGRTTFPGLDASSFMHPSDREAMKKLAKLPGMQPLLRRISGGYIERMYRMLNIAERVQVTPRQCPRIYNLFREACNTLDIKEIPEVFLSTAYIPNAMTFGIEKYSIVLLTGLVDLLNEDELLFVIGHELSHIKSNHMMYKTLLYLLTFVGIEIFGIFFKVAAITFFPIEMALRNWERKAEITCDRGGLLVVQNQEIAERALVKLAGYSRTLASDIDMKEILKQADELKNMDEETFVRAMKIYHNMFRSHPFPIIRIKELHNWSQSNQFQRILKGDYQRSS